MIFDSALTILTDFAGKLPIFIVCILVFNLISDILWGGR